MKHHERTELEEWSAAAQVAALLPGATMRRVPSKRGLREVRLHYSALRAGMLDDFGRLGDPAYVVDPHPAGRYGWVIFEDGTRCSSGEYVGIWVRDMHGGESRSQLSGSDAVSSWPPRPHHCADPIVRGEYSDPCGDC